MSQYLYLLRPSRVEMLTVGPTPEEAEIVSRHFAHLQALTAQGVTLLMGRTQDNSAETFGIVIFVADDDEHARAIMQSDPAVIHDVMRATLFPFRIALHGRLPDDDSAVA